MLTGKDYPWLCKECQNMVDSIAMLYGEGDMEDTDDDEAACNYVYDHRLFCGGHTCKNDE